MSDSPKTLPSPTTQLAVLRAETETSDHVNRILQDSLAYNTHVNYQLWWERFETWGGSLPCSPAELAEYLAAHEESHYIATLRAWTAAINRVHAGAGYPKPANTTLVRDLLTGIANRQLERGQMETRVDPILVEHLERIIGCMGNRLIDLRDKAILLIGFSGAMRRSELAAVRTSHLSFSPEGLRILIPKTKTKKPRTVAIPYGSGPLCPIRNLEAWLDELNGGCATDEVIFRKIDHRGTIWKERTITRRGIEIKVGLHPKSIAKIIKRCCALANYNAEDFSGHSLRAGYITQLAKNGTDIWRIMDQSGHTNYDMVRRYIRDAQHFEDNPLDGLF